MRENSLTGNGADISPEEWVEQTALMSLFEVSSPDALHGQAGQRKVEDFIVENTLRGDRVAEKIIDRCAIPKTIERAVQRVLEHCFSKRVVNVPVFRFGDFDVISYLKANDHLQSVLTDGIINLIKDGVAVNLYLKFTTEETLKNILVALIKNGVSTARFLQSVEMENISSQPLRDFIRSPEVSQQIIKDMITSANRNSRGDE